MFTPARRRFRNEQGMSLVFVGLGLMGFVAATMLAIDVGMLMNARTQAQTAADAGAHAGAVALAFVDYDDRTPSGPAVTSALREARGNQVLGANVSVEPTDVVFLNDPTGEPNRVQVTVYRSASRGNPFALFIAPLFGVDTASTGASATAEASPADIPPRCLPFTIPDKWNEITLPPFNADESEFNKYDRHNNPITPRDVYIEADQDDYTGYDPVTDRGTLVVLKESVDTTVAPSTYNPIVVPGEGTGAERYRQAIIQGICPGDYAWKSALTSEPGGMTGPTKQGIEELIAKDPDAVWDESCDCIRGSRFNPPTDSPRVAAIPLYDPEHFADGKHNGRLADFRVANYLGVFVVEMRGNDVLARITPMGGGRTGDPDIPGGMFMRAIRIVQ